jgi:hypothetical protein
MRRADSPSCAMPVIALSRVPKLDEPLAGLGESCVWTAAASAQTWPSYEVVVNGTTFTIGVDEKHSVRYVATSDPSFATAEGLHVGDAATEALKAAPGRMVMRERGWGTFVVLPSGWSVLLDDSTLDANGRLDLNLGTRELGPSARVAMFFRR